MKETIVILSGWAVPRFVWEPFMTLLEKEYKVLYIDWDDIKTITLYQKKVFERLRAEKIESFSLIGWSLGSIVAIEVMATKQYEIKKCILISGTSKFTNDEGYQVGLHEKILQRMIQKYKTDPKITLKNFYKNLFSKKEKKMNYEENFFNNVTYEMYSSTLASGLEYLLKKDMRHVLTVLECDVLLIHGQEDQICPVKSAYFLQGKLKNVSLICYPNTGHIPFYIHPIFCYQDIHSFIRG